MPRSAHTTDRTGLLRLSIGMAAGLVLLLSCTAVTVPYGPRDPALSVAINDEVVLIAAADRPMPVRIFYPGIGGPYPLIVLSHGTFSNRYRYDRIAEYWAGQGYVVMLPQHIDADYGVTPSSYDFMQDVVRMRAADMTLVLDSLERIESTQPALKGRISHDAFIAAGHSIGTQVAMLVTGGRFRTAFNGEDMTADESRYRALVLVSDPGKMRLMPLNMWRAAAVPTFMATGTEDFGLMGGRGAPAEPQTVLLSLGIAPDVPRYELLLEHGDHYFGGLVQKEVDAEPDHEGLAIFNTTSTAFLDAVIKQDPRAREYLDTVDLPAATGGRATLTSK